MAIVQANLILIIQHSKVSNMAENLNSRVFRNKTSKGLSKDHSLRKRQPQKFETGDAIIYVSTKSDVKALRQKCEKLLRQNEEEVIIYCMGAAIPRGIILALQICENHLSYQVSTNTLTTELIDDLEPAVDEADYEIQRRNNSALRIKVFRTDLLDTSTKSLTV